MPTTFQRRTQGIKKIKKQPLQPSEPRFRLLVQSVEDYAIFMLDPDGNIISWNAGARRVKGYRQSEILGKHFSVFYTREDRLAGTPMKGLATAAKAGRFEAEGWRVRKGGSRFWASVVITPMRTENRIVGFAKVTRDLTKRKEAEESLKQLTRQLAQSQEEERLQTRPCPA